MDSLQFLCDGSTAEPDWQVGHPIVSFRPDEMIDGLVTGTQRTRILDFFLLLFSLYSSLSILFIDVVGMLGESQQM